MRIAAVLCLLIVGVGVGVAWWCAQGIDVEPALGNSRAVTSKQSPAITHEGADYQAVVSGKNGSPVVDRTLAGQSLTVCVRDAQGQLIDGAELVESTGRRRRSPDYSEQLLLLSILGDEHALFRDEVEAVPMENGQLTVSYPEGAWVGFAVRAPGFRSIARAYPANDVPVQVDLEMSRAGGLRGTVVGGKPVGGMVLVRVWRASKVPVDGTSGFPSGLQIDSEGGFVDENIEPGTYRAALKRLSYQHMVDKQGDVLLLDQGTDQRGAVEFVVRADEETVIELTPPILGVLRGWVLLRGQPVTTPSVRVMASRPGEPIPGAELQAVDWDMLNFGGHPLSQQTAPGGSFRLLYAKAGPVELRLRHPDGHAISKPVTVTLPPPSATDFVHDLELPAGEVCGRVAMASLEAEARTVTVALYPMHRAAEDPTFSPGWGLPILSKCAVVKETATGGFAFRYLPPGEWLLRVHDTGVDDELLWQRVVNVPAGLLDLAVVERPELVSATIRYDWDLRNAQAARAPSTMGLRLFRGHGGKSGAVWVATLRYSGRCAWIEPGHYTVVPFSNGNPFCLSDSGNGMNGPATAKPVQIEIRSDGSVHPNPVRFSPLPRPAKPTDHK